MNKTTLHQLGFSEKEADVYLALNTYGPSAASTLARLTRIKRTSVYDATNALLSKNLIVTYRQGSTTFYAIDDVNKLLYSEREKLTLAETAIRQLKAEQLDPHAVQVTHYQGQEGYREMYEEILRANPKELMAWINLDEFYRDLDPVREEEWTQERIQKKIWTRLLMQDTPLARKFQKKDAGSCRQTILLPKSFPFRSNSFLYKGHVTFFDAHENITGIRIKHSEIYRMQKQIFEMSWKAYRA